MLGVVIHVHVVHSVVGYGMHSVVGYRMVWWGMACTVWWGIALHFNHTVCTQQGLSLPSSLLYVHVHTCT